MSHAIWLAIAGAGCGDNINMFESGSRLEAIIESGGAGSDVLSHFRDRARDEDCVFAPGRSGSWRCFPRLRGTVVGFADADCTQPIYRCDHCTPGDTQVTIVEGGCATPIAVPHELTPTEDPTFVLALNGICVPIVAPAAPYYSASPLDDEPYVVAMFDDRDVGAGLGARSLVSADGAREMHHAYSLADRRSCTFVGGPRQPRTCLPGTPARTELGLVYFFDSDTCSTRVAHSPPSGECEETTHVAVEGEAHTVVRELPAPAFERSPVDSSCTATQKAFRFWEIGPEDETLPTAELIAFGQGAARPVYYAAFGSPLEFSGRWVDDQAISCFPTETIRGRRCLPRAITLPLDASWADPQCTEELVYNPEDATHAVRFDGGMVGSVHPLSPYRSEDVFVRRAGVCTLLPDSATLMSHVGASVDLVGYAELVVRPAGS
jgi:hypothetical protein